MYEFLCSKCPITHTNIKAVTQSEICTFKQSRIVSDLVFKFIQQINLAANIYKTAWYHTNYLMLLYYWHLL